MVKYEDHTQQNAFVHSLFVLLFSCRCVDGDDALFSSLLTTGSPPCSTSNLGTFDLECGQPDDASSNALFTSSVPVAVINKGGNGGVIYGGLLPGITYIISTGS